MDAKEMLSKYWYYGVGAILGLYLVMRYMAGSTAAPSGSSDLAAFYSAQTAQGQQAMQLAAQTAQIQATNDAAARSDALARDTLTAQTTVATIQAQAQMAQAVGQSAAGVVGALYGPTVQAINSAGQENAAAFQSAAVIAGTGFQSQAAIVDSTSKSLATVPQGLNVWSGLSQGIGSMLNPIQFPSSSNSSTGGYPNSGQNKPATLFGQSGSVF